LAADGEVEARVFFVFGIENECVVDAFILRFPRYASDKAFGFAGEGFGVVLVWDADTNFYGAEPAAEAFVLGHLKHAVKRGVFWT
jgi:hypothetical protein